MLKTAIIGAGNMGSALYQGIRQSADTHDVYLCDHNESKLAIAPADCRFTNVLQATQEGTMSAPEWRKAVTSKGGVTEAAVKVFSEKKLSEIFHEALEAGTLRSRSLSSENE